MPASYAPLAAPSQPAAPPKKKPPQKTSIGFYEEDLKNIFRIEDALPRGRYSYSELVRIALAGFDPQFVDARALLKRVRSLDERRSNRSG